MEYSVKTSEYNGKPIVELWDESGRIMSFGERKAKAIVALHEDIQRWLFNLRTERIERAEVE